MSLRFTLGCDILNSSDANIGYLPQLTSYNFYASLTEAGDLTLENGISLCSRSTFNVHIRPLKFLVTF